MSQGANAFLLERLPGDCLGDRYARRTRTVADQFAHMHAVRIRWLEVAAPDLAEALPRLGDDERDAEDLGRALEASAEAVARFLERCETAGRVPKWNGPPASFLAYLVAHEGHHRGLAMVAARLSGHRMPNEVVYGQWEWGKAVRGG